MMKGHCFRGQIERSSHRDEEMEGQVDLQIGRENKVVSGSTVRRMCSVLVTRSYALSP